MFDIYRTRCGAALTLAGDRAAARRVSNELQNRWRAFARTGDPGEGWPAYTLAHRAVMVFDRQSRLEYDPHPRRRAAWSGFSLAQ